MVNVGLVAVDGMDREGLPAGFGSQSWQEAHRRQVASAGDALFGADGRGGESSSQLCDRSARRRAVGDSWPRRLSRTLLGCSLLESWSPRT